MVSGSVTVRDLNRQLEWDLPDDEASTVAGLLIHEAQTIPTVGESFVIHGCRFTVIEKVAMQLTRLRIEHIQEHNSLDESSL
jgi:Mg2+/Co2+ transporter CorB